MSTKITEMTSSEYCTGRVQSLWNFKTGMRKNSYPMPGVEIELGRSLDFVAI